MATATLKWMDPHEGHKTLPYDTEVHDEVKAAEELFDKLLAETQDHAGAQTLGRRAYVITKEKSGKRVADREIKEFDPLAEEILVVSPMQGG